MNGCTFFEKCLLFYLQINKKMQQCAILYIHEMDRNIRRIRQVDAIVHCVSVQGSDWLGISGDWQGKNFGQGIVRGFC